MVANAEPEPPRPDTRVPDSRPPAAPAPGARPPADDWRVIVAIFWITSMVEGLGVSQIFAFVPLYLSQMGVAEPDRLRFVGIFGSLIFIVGAPLVPLWGVWADKYSRKAVIVRSALVEAVVFAGVALSREPWQLALSMLLVGLQLGNTGVMLAAIRDVVPAGRLGHDDRGLRGERPGRIRGRADPRRVHRRRTRAARVGDLLGVVGAVGRNGAPRRPRLARGPPRGRAAGPGRRPGVRRDSGVLSDPAVRRLFTIFGIAFLAAQMSRPYIPVLVERVSVDTTGLASSIALVAGAGALVGALISPVGGWIGDRIGFRPVLVAALAGGGVASLLMPLVGTVGLLAVVAVALAACSAAVGAMIIGLLALEVPSERRSATLNLVYLPLYVAGIIGPTLGALVVSAGLWAPFWFGAAVYLVGALVVATRRPQPAPVGSAG